MPSENYRMDNLSRSTPPFRTDHVGSLIRPQRLVDVHEQWLVGDFGIENLRAVEDQAIREAIGLQESVGLQSITDGEFRRSSWRHGDPHPLGLPDSY